MPLVSNSSCGYSSVGGGGGVIHEDQVWDRCGGRGVRSDGWRRVSVMDGGSGKWGGAMSSSVVMGSGE